MLSMILIISMVLVVMTSFSDGNPIDSSWPQGTYALPSLKSGCPSASSFSWKFLQRNLDLESDSKPISMSKDFLIDLNITDDSLDIGFCVKEDAIGSHSWPDGRYCLYQSGNSCPDGLTPGLVTFGSGEEDPKAQSLTDNKILFEEDSRLDFCCRTTGRTDSPIRNLPTKVAFALLPYETTKCPPVDQMTAKLNSIVLKKDAVKDKNKRSGSIPPGLTNSPKIIHFCTYIPGTDNALQHISTVKLPLATGPATAISSPSPSGSSGKNMPSALGQDDTPRLATATGNTKIFPAASNTLIAATVVGLIGAAFVIGVTALLITRHLTVTRGGSKRTAGANYTPVRRDQSPPLPSLTVPPKTMQASVNATKSELQSINQSPFRNPAVAQINSTKGRREVDRSDDEMSLAVTDFDDEELVEDRLLPDSELKKGLELMFLKQQRHYWNKRRTKDKSQERITRPPQLRRT